MLHRGVAHRNAVQQRLSRSQQKLQQARELTVGHVYVVLPLQRTLQPIELSM